MPERRTLTGLAEGLARAGKAEQGSAPFETDLHLNWGLTLWLLACFGALCALTGSGTPRLASRFFLCLLTRPLVFGLELGAILGLVIVDRSQMSE